MESTRIQQRFLTLLFLTFSIFSLKSNATTEAEALVKWRSSLYETNNSSLSSWSLTNSSTPCKWFGVHCDSVGRVVQLWLPNANLSGTLHELDFSCLSSLAQLNLSGNNLYGSIPANICATSKLTSLDLSDNSFNQSINSPLVMLKCTNLIYLYLSGNTFTGPIPESLSTNLPNLNYLNLSFNSFEGEIPASFSNLLRLCDLRLRANRLTGGIPRSLASLTKMQEFDVSNNSLSGELSPDFFANWTELIAFRVQNNSFTGKIPPEIGLATKLQVVHLSDNQFSGPVPPEIGELSDLYGLDMSQNSLTGVIPPTVSNLEQLQFMFFFGNKLSGTKYMSLMHNNLSGSIPDQIFSELSLQSLHLNNNSFTGEFPPALKHCKDLVTLDLGENIFYGQIPSWIGESFPSLKVLRLTSNTFHGSIPTEVSLLSSLRLLDLSLNNLSGSIPPTLGNLAGMTGKRSSGGWFIDRSLYEYMDNISLVWKGRAYAFQRTLSFLTAIVLSGNCLTDEIPRELANLSGLVQLDLSRNRLSGRIPDEIGKLQMLESLDLSMNRLSGAIPPAISSLTFLDFLNVSYNNLSGRVPWGFQLQTLTDPSIYKGNAGLCGPPFLTPCLDHGASVPRHDHGDERNEGADDDNNWLVFSIELGFALGFGGIFSPLFFSSSWRSSYFAVIDCILDGFK
ncbi:uncharacterized protein [Typha angustifolia]|uniref:uncharacterized protein isoform X2 n=1 Tax=Typha angustifolia TaxID=59011 RepID=UPI003C2BC2E6